MDGVVLAAPSSTRAVDALAPADLAAGFAEMVRRFVRFAAAHPELNQIMVHEATESSDRLTWMVANYVRPFYDTVRAVWARLREAGYAAPVEASMVHWVLVGAASLPYVNAPEARLLTGEEPTDPAWVGERRRRSVHVHLSRQRPARRRRRRQHRADARPRQLRVHRQRRADARARTLGQRRLRRRAGLQLIRITTPRETP
jgi:hypothetical protein